MWVTLHSNWGCACPVTGRCGLLFLCACEGSIQLGSEWELVVTPPNFRQVCIIAHTIAARPQVMGSVSPAGAVVGTFIATTLLYTVILLVSICALIYWNKRHRYC